MAHQRGLRRDVNLTDEEAMEERIEEVFPIEKPSPLHGDLWSGNAIPSRGDEITLIDLAVYFGHRYMDLALTKLFGGSPDAIYKGYESGYPLEGDVHEGMLLAQLDPILVHVVFFREG